MYSGKPIIVEDWDVHGRGTLPLANPRLAERLRKEAEKIRSMARLRRSPDPSADVGTNSEEN